LIVIASIHQPSTSTFELFDKLTLLSHGKTCYCGPVTDVKSYFDNLGFPMPAQMNPAEFILELTNVDFARDKATAMEHIDKIQQAWATHKTDNATCQLLPEEKGLQSLRVNKQSYATRVLIPVVLLHRLLIKSFRDIVAYGIRIVMYTGKPAAHLG
jgi:ABC-type multidrug transport system ATPase subunit